MAIIKHTKIAVVLFCLIFPFILIKSFSLTPKIIRNKYDYMYINDSSLAENIRSLEKQDHKQHVILSKNQRLLYLDNINSTNPMEMYAPIPFINKTKNPCFYDKDEKLRCLPYFFILSSQKCGTTDLFDLLSKHKHIVPSKRKEVHWFDRSRFGGVERYYANSTKRMTLRANTDNYATLPQLLA